MMSFWFPVCSYYRNQYLHVYTSVYPSVLGRYAEQMLLSMYQILHIWIKPGEENQHLGKQLQIAGVCFHEVGAQGKCSFY